MADPSFETTDAASTRVCSRTGLRLVRYPAPGTWRIFDNTRGATSGRPRQGTDPENWNRFDRDGRVTLYSSTTRTGALAELLANFRPRINELASLAAEVFDDVDPGDDPITDEWCQSGHMIPGNLPSGWVDQHALARIRVDRSGWYVDVEDLGTRQVLRTTLAAFLDSYGIQDVDVSTIRSNDRRITCKIAEWTVAQYLDDGTTPLGIKYNSRHDSEWECWASFEEARPTSDHQEGLQMSDPDLQQLCDAFGLRIHHPGF